MDWELWVVVACVGLSFLFSASETAITSLGRLEIQTLVARGGRSGRLAHNWARHPSRFLTTVLVGNNVVNTVASSMLTVWVKERHPTSLSATIALFTVFFIVFSEITPKVLARQFSLALSVPALGFLKTFSYVVAPMNFLMIPISRLISVVTGRPGGDIYKPLTEEELEQTIQMATKEGGIDRATGEVLSNLMGFQDQIARDIMVARTKIQAIPVHWSQEQALRFIAADGHSRYPVVRNSLDDVVGVVLVKDLLAHIQRAAPGSWTRVIRKPYWISEMTPLGAVLRDMKRAGTHLALVRNETGVLTGIVTLEDLLEEIVGNIRDEHDDPSEAGFENAIGGPILVTGEMPIVDFNDRYRMSLPVEGSYSTLNGYLLQRTGGQIPPIGTLVFADDVTFRVHAVSDAGVATLEILDQLREREVT